MMLFIRASVVLVIWSANVAQAACPTATHVDIYPTADELPANTLRMFVYYPRPMKADEGLKNVQLLDQTGTVLSGVFLANRADLWSPDRRRLTLLLDPGRVKTGLVANAALSRALVPGQSYTLAVSGSASDISGCALGADTRFEFTVGEADKEAPDPEIWTFDAPEANSTDTLSVDLGSTHDHLSLAYRLRVVDQEGVTVPGTIALGPAEAVWEFTPNSPWAPTTYRLTIDAQLEDLAGNRPGVLFDQPPNREPEPWAHSLQIVPKPPAHQ